jgi:exodeoxyribonuclease V alpha subunit
MASSLWNNLVFIGDLVQLGYINREEKFVAECIVKLIKENNNQVNIFEQIQAYPELDTDQKQAVDGCFGNRIFCVSGLAGTGKSYVVSMIYKIAINLKINCLMATPTGKAAKRVTDMSGGECKTIHRMLGYAPNAGEVFRFNENNKLDCDMLIIDEASMVDLNILYHLFKAVNLDTIRICFVGDYKQLAPVRYGNPFKDMCLNFHVPKAILTQIKRQKIGSDIIEQAHRIQQGKMISI